MPWLPRLHSEDEDRRFIAEHGFAEVELTDGADNEEREPDVLLAWKG